ncbi:MULTISPECIES: dimethylamine monooxygenase subunit DmmA family protein [unclassified Burkholderia]|uniref:dimethylamine monooxygenase subunit DmmA family protein n=1 Tax=unclassified Burkholderia TaxID=2613784 RepID=UPI000F57941E|nr:MULTISPECIES: dimethylamine monooxygenase subunit DmmA family protein [unclassified Burkholderia]
MHSIEPFAARSRQPQPAHTPFVPPSLPHYAPLQPCAEARSHLVVAQGDALHALPAFINALAGLPGSALLVTLGKLQAIGLPAVFHASLDTLEDEVRHRLNESTVGVRLYVCGDETFVWHIRRIAQAVGLLPEEVAAAVSGTRRTVYCVHCGAAHAHDGHDEPDEVTCPSCDVRLSVRQHFSARLGAYLGVCADADRPCAGDRA